MALQAGMRVCFSRQDQTGSWAPARIRCAFSDQEGGAEVAWGRQEGKKRGPGRGEGGTQERRPGEERGKTNQQERRGRNATGASRSDQRNKLAGEPASVGAGETPQRRP